jgi:hypothetical protein
MDSFSSIPSSKAQVAQMPTLTDNIASANQEKPIFLKHSPQTILTALDGAVRTTRAHQLAAHGADAPRRQYDPHQGAPSPKSHVVRNRKFGKGEGQSYFFHIRRSHQGRGKKIISDSQTTSSGPPSSSHALPRTASTARPPPKFSSLPEDVNSLLKIKLAATYA